MEALFNWLEKDQFISLKEIQAIRKLTSNALSTCYRIETHTSKYIIKMYDAEIAQTLYKLNLDDLISQVEYQESVIQDASQNRYEVPHAISFNGHIYVPFEKYLIYIMDFIEGEILNITSYTLKQVSDVGRALALVHQVDFSKYRMEHWENKKNCVKNYATIFLNMYDPQKIKMAFPFLDQAFIDFLDQNVQAFVKGPIYNMDISKTQQNLVFSHYDIKPKNILWKNPETFIILDWETSCLHFRSCDYLETLLAFGHTTEEGNFYIHLDYIDAFKNGYQSVYPEKIVIEDKDIHALVFGEVIWLHVNLLNNNQEEVKKIISYLTFIQKNIPFLKSL
ncbi:MAG: hypothetical protein BGO14_11870 [Chlamydiales bacterium 38-26]|nr:phosphotransferase [Chlamydiales bacterium]OJV11634.1 MAG: hypothetical protein BGO14_11870 [Chlamydiales bacterium 38-26]